jgi:hypothetical protein
LVSIGLVLSEEKIFEKVYDVRGPLLLKIEHMVKLQIFGNNSKTVNNIKNLTWDKNDQHIKPFGSGELIIITGQKL